MPRAILTFHSVDDSGSILSFPVRKFRRLVHCLAADGVPVVSYGELARRDHGVTITFDDGMRSVHDHALPVLRDHGFPAHLFLCTGMVGGHARWPTHGGATAEYAMLDWDAVGACARDGIRMECHTVTHPDLRTLGSAQIASECERADEEIARRVGRRPTLFAYPFGFHDTAVREAVGARYEGCFTTRLGYLGARPDASQLPRLDTYYFQSPVHYERLFTPASRSYVAFRSLLRSLRGTQ
jgi:peptidoglycan/xylan/chitin deacetylase (PgdA/CDA1 family)